MYCFLSLIPPPFLTPCFDGGLEHVKYITYKKLSQEH